MWRGVGLANLIRAELSPYATDTNTDVEVPAVYLTPIASHAVAMVLHELATAAKYRALSQPGGHVSVRWTSTAEHTPAAMLRIEWQETGGPEVAPPARQGYKSSVIRDLLTHELSGRADLAFAANGVQCAIEMPATRETIGWIEGARLRRSISRALSPKEDDSRPPRHFLGSITRRLTASCHSRRAKASRERAARYHLARRTSCPMRADVPSFAAIILPCWVTLARQWSSKASLPTL
jgi:hypothetical protein